MGPPSLFLAGKRMATSTENLPLQAEQPAVASQVLSALVQGKQRRGGVLSSPVEPSLACGHVVGRNLGSGRIGLPLGMVTNRSVTPHLPPGSPLMLHVPHRNRAVHSPLQVGIGAGEGQGPVLGPSGRAKQAKVQDPIQPG